MRVSLAAVGGMAPLIIILPLLPGPSGFQKVHRVRQRMRYVYSTITTATTASQKSPLVTGVVDRTNLEMPASESS